MADYYGKRFSLLQSLLRADRERAEAEVQELNQIAALPIPQPPVQILVTQPTPLRRVCSGIEKRNRMAYVPPKGSIALGLLYRSY